MSSHKLSVAAICLGFALVGQVSGARNARAEEQASGQLATPESLARLGSLTQPLLDSANYWRAHGRPLAALNQLERILSYSPDDLAILATAAEVALEAKDYVKAANYRVRFSKAAAAIARPPAHVAAAPAEPEKVRPPDGAPAFGVAAPSEPVQAAAPVAPPTPATDHRSELLGETIPLAMNDETRISVLNAMGRYGEPSGSGVSQ